MVTSDGGESFVSDSEWSGDEDESDQTSSSESSSDMSELCPKGHGRPVGDEGSNVKNLMRTIDGNKDGSELQNIYNNSNTSNPQE